MEQFWAIPKGFKMKTVLLLGLALGLAGGVSANGLDSLRDRVTGQVLRKSSCTYNLTIVGAASNRTRPIKRSANNVKEACALAKTACTKIGSKEGFFGKHSCQKVNADSGGIVTRVLEGDLPQRRRDQQPSARTLNRTIRNLEQQNFDLTEELAEQERLVHSLREDLNSQVGTNLEHENSDLKKSLRRLKRKLKNAESRNAKKRSLISRLQRELDSYTNNDQSSKINACGKAFPVLPMGRDECISRQSSPALIHACHRAFPNRAYARIACLDIEASTGLVKACHKAYPVSYSDRTSCIRNNK